MTEWTKVETETWTPEEGEEISGEYLGVQVEVGENKSNLYKVKTEEGKTVGIWGSAVLDGKMFGMEVGTEIKIAFKGKVKPLKGREYKDYEVFTKKDSNEESGVDVY